MASRIKRSVPVTISEVLDGHTELDLECLDRVYLHGYLARLQCAPIAGVSRVCGGP